MPEPAIAEPPAPPAAAIGAAPPRKEDLRFLRGEGRFLANRVLDGEAHAVFVRAPAAHARIRAVETREAARAPGVLAVLTGADARADRLGGIPWEVRPPQPEGAAGGSLPPIGDPSVAPPQPVMAAHRVRHVGEILAMVVAETAARARDAAELVGLELDELPAAIGAAPPRRPGAPAIHAAFPDGRAFTMERGDAEAVDRAFAAAHHVARLRSVNQRILANPIETRGAVGVYDPDAGRYTLFTPAGKPHPVRDTLARAVFGIPPEWIRVVAGDIGGGFGAKNVLYPEQCLVLWAARRLGRPVKWIQDRIEAAQSDMQGRGQTISVALAIDEDGRFTALRVAAVADLGAHFAPRAVNPATLHRLILPSVYDIPLLHLRVEGVFSNAAPTCSIRGAGAPESVFALERAIDIAAREIDADPVALRRRNLIPEAAMPYRTAFGLRYDCGQFARNMDRAAALIDRDGFPARRVAAAGRGRCRGLAFANLLEVHGAGIGEVAELRVDARGRPTVLIGTQSSGQGHETVYAQIAAEALGAPLADVTVVQGDTDQVAEGNGTGASRSLIVGGSALLGAADGVVAQARAVAAHLLESAVADIAFAGGVFRVAGTDRAVGLREVADAAHDPARLPAGAAPGLSGRARFDPEAPTFPNGCHACEVEVDPETGAVEIAAYALVQDSGIQVHPAIVEGQIQGGAAYGIGQALCEDARCDPETGQVLRATFMDYAMPRASDIPSFRFHAVELPCANNPLGVKACGESGAAGPPPAVVGAIVDALRGFGVRHVEMPATPERVWRAIRDARTGRAAAAAPSDGPA